MPRPCRYASTIVPVIGCDTAKRRRADSGELIGAGGGMTFGSDAGSARGRLRKRRASSAASGKRRKPQLSRITSSRSPCSLVAPSVHLPAAPYRRPGQSGGRTSSGPACCGHRRSASSGLRAGHWKDSGGTPPRHCARDVEPVRQHHWASLHHFLLGDRGQRMSSWTRMMASSGGWR